MECFKCQSSNPEGKKFCGDCGALLDSNLGAVESYLQDNLPFRLQEILKQQYKDSKLVEMEITEAVANRFSNWGKQIAFFIGIPIAFLLFLLGAQGIKSYADFIAKVDTAKKDTEQRLESAKREGDSLMGEYEKLRTQLAEVRTLSGEVEKLSTKVKNIENEIGIEQTGNLTPELKKDLESSFRTFIPYLERLGYKHKGGRVRVQVIEEADDNAYYISNQNLIQIGPALSGDKQVAYHTYTMYALSSINESASNNILLQSTVSGLADYFACSFSNNPRLGEISAKEINKRKGADIYKEGYLRNLENNLNFENIDNMNPVQAGEIWGGAFWEIRQLYGQEKADKLLFSTWSQMKNLNKDKTDGSIKFVNKLIEINKSMNGNEQSEQLRSIFERRGFKF